MDITAKIKYIVKDVGHKAVIFALAVSMAVNPFSPTNYAVAATLNAGSNFTACTAQAVLAPFSGAATVYWTFSSAVGNTQASYRVQIDDDPNFGSVNVDSGTVGDASARFYGATGLTLGARYYWRLLITDNNASVTDWIAGDSFLLLIPSLNLKGGLKLQGDIKLK